jgi:hypothetical protein
MSKFNTPTGRSIQKQGLFGLALFVLAFAWGYVLAQGHDMQALDQDPTPLMPAVILGGVGAFVIVVARFRLLFYRPQDELGRATRKGIVRILEGLVD